MRVFGNLMNRLAETARGPEEIAIGMGATILMFSDRHAATVVNVLKTKGGKVRGVVIQEDKAIRIDNNGMSESQEYRYEANPNAMPTEYSLRKNGTFVRHGESMRSGQILAVGYRDSYHDYSF